MKEMWNQETSPVTPKSYRTLHFFSGQLKRLNLSEMLGFVCKGIVAKITRNIALIMYLA